MYPTLRKIAIRMSKNCFKKIRNSNGNCPEPPDDQLYIALSTGVCDVELVSPKPVDLGGDMLVTCSVDAIGGAGQLTELGLSRTVVSVELFMVSKDNETGQLSKQLMAKYSPLDQWLVEVSFGVVGPPNITV